LVAARQQLDYFIARRSFIGEPVALVDRLG